jgi:hypothetical protein
MGLVPWFAVLSPGCAGFHVGYPAGQLGGGRGQLVRVVMTSAGQGPRGRRPPARLPAPRRRQAGSRDHMLAASIGGLPGTTPQRALTASSSAAIDAPEARRLHRSRLSPRETHACPRYVRCLRSEIWMRGHTAVYRCAPQAVCFTTDLLRLGRRKPILAEAPGAGPRGGFRPRRPPQRACHGVGWMPQRHAPLRHRTPCAEVGAFVRGSRAQEVLHSTESSGQI